MNPATYGTEMDRSPKPEEPMPAEGECALGSDVARDSSACWEGVEAMFRSWRQRYRGSVLCEK